MKGVISWLLVGLVVPVQEIFVLFGYSSRYSTKHFFPHRTLFQSFSPSPSKLGRQPCWVACLLVCVSGQNLTDNLCVGEWDEEGAGNPFLV